MATAISYGAPVPTVPRSSAPSCARTAISPNSKSIIPLERLTAEIKQRTKVAGISSNDTSIVRLVGSMMEQSVATRGAPTGTILIKWCSQIFAYAAGEELCDNDPTTLLKGSV
ncbi:MAG: hypothetical protein KA738_00085 [Pseudoxanthomonas sp.]|nr:hypothetical protein [Pseudoxanthomonas sp.]